MISESGSIMSRFARAQFVAAKNNNEAIKIFSPPNSQRLLEFGPLYVRTYDFDGNLLNETVTPYTAANIENMHFVPTGNYVYLYVINVFLYKFDYVNYVLTLGPFYVDTSISKVSSGSVTAHGSPSGYQVDYAYALVYRGEELIVDVITLAGTYYKPNGSGQSNTIALDLGAVAASINY